MKEQFFNNSNIFGYVLHENKEGVIYTNDFDIKITMEPINDKLCEIVGCIIDEDSLYPCVDIKITADGIYKVSSSIITGLLMDIDGTITINKISYTLTGSRILSNNNYIDIFLPPKKII